MIGQNEDKSDIVIGEKELKKLGEYAVDVKIPLRSDLSNAETSAALTVAALERYIMELGLTPQITLGSELYKNE